MQKLIKILIHFCFLMFISYSNAFEKKYTNGIFDYDALQDASAVKQMFVDHWQILGCDDENDSSGDLNRCIADASIFCKVIRQNGKTIGFISYDQEGTDSLFIYHLVIDRNFYHQGYATSLLQFVVNDGLERGCHKIALCVDVDNQIARDLYEKKFDFKITSVRLEYKLNTKDNYKAAYEINKKK